MQQQDLHPQQNQPFPQRILVRAIAFTLLACVATTLSGCVSYTSDQQILHLRVPSETPLQQIELGQTSSAWLLEELGEPDAVHTARGHDEVWVYENIAEESTRLRAFPLIGLHSQELQTTKYRFAVERNVIVHYWKELL